MAPRRIGVFRALQLGDMLCAVPVLRALKAAWPDSELTLIGLPWAHELAQRLDTVDRFVAFPGCPGLPEIPPDTAALPQFLQQMREQRFDLLLQLHGSGSIVNPLLAEFGARRRVGFAEPAADGSLLPDHVRWPTTGHEIERLLSLVDHLGIARQGRALEFPLTGADRRAAAALLASLKSKPHACLHAGAQLPSRRWPPERFAAIGDALAAHGLAVVLTGTGGEAELVARVQAAMQAPALNLAGRTDLWTLGALLEGARLLVCNDTGVSHVAAALRTPSVVISSGGDVQRWAPDDAVLHRVLWQPMACRPCAYRDCPYGHGCATAIGVDQVADTVRAVLGRARSECMTEGVRSP